MKLDIDGTEILHSMIIADIEAPVILGYDFMYDHNCSLDICNASLKIGEAQIQCNREGQEDYVFRIRLESDVTVPPGCEMMVRGKVDAKNSIFHKSLKPLSSRKLKVF